MSIIILEQYVKFHVLSNQGDLILIEAGVLCIIIELILVIWVLEIFNWIKEFHNEASMAHDKNILFTFKIC